MRLYLEATFLLYTVASATTCYDTQGNIDPLFEVCIPSIPVSVCCHQADFCMTNGLCLNAGANNLLGVQGCTDKGWGAPCKQYCALGSVEHSPNVFPCPLSGSEVSWCCGTNTTDCCNKGSGFTIPVGKLFLRDSQQPNSTSASSASPTSAINNPPTTPSNSAATTSATSTSTISSTPSSNSSRDKSLSIGLGVGIPLGIIATAVLAFLTWELRRYNNKQAQRTRSDAVPEHRNRDQDLKMGQPAELNAPYGSELDARDQIYELPQAQRVSRHQ